MLDATSLMATQEFGAWGRRHWTFDDGYRGHVDDVMVGSSFCFVDGLQLGVCRGRCRYVTFFIMTVEIRGLQWYGTSLPL